MLSNKQVRQIYNYLAKKKYKKSYHSLTSRQAELIRKIAVKLK